MLQRKGPSGLKHIEIRCLSIQQWIREKRLSVSRVDTKNKTADLFTKHLDVFAYTSTCEAIGTTLSGYGWWTNVDMADGGTNEKDRR